MLSVEYFNSAAAEFQVTDFPRAGTPTEWQRLHQTRHSRDYDKLLRTVSPLLTAFAAAGEDDCASASSALNTEALAILATFAEYMPVLAVRRGLPDLIRDGLRALALIGDRDDLRDLTFPLAALYHAATKLEIDPVKLFADVASLVLSAPLRDAMCRFPLRSPEIRDLRAFCLRETMTDGEFDIVSVPIK